VDLTLEQQELLSGGISLGDTDSIDLENIAGINIQDLFSSFGSGGLLTTLNSSMIGGDSEITEVTETDDSN
jgi:hypothetical protein